MEKKIFSLEKKFSYSNLSKKEKHALYSRRDDTSIIIKEADKSSEIVVWDGEDYLAKVRAQLKKIKMYTKSLRETLNVLFRRLLKVFYVK